jgi:hypothetical protein
MIKFVVHYLFWGYVCLDILIVTIMPLGRSRRNKSSSSAVSEDEGASPINMTAVTTVMVRNIPTRYTSLGLIEVLKDHGFEKTFDFIYLPMDWRTRKNCGYAFLNFINPEYVEKFMSQFQGLQLKANTSQKTLEIIPSRRQGFFENIGVFGASELLTSNVSQPHFKPLVMVHGELVPLTDKLYDQLVIDRSVSLELLNPPQIKVE